MTYRKIFTANAILLFLLKQNVDHFQAQCCIPSMLKTLGFSVESTSLADEKHIQ
jgi:hypothetical protein